MVGGWGGSRAGATERDDNETGEEEKRGKWRTSGAGGKREAGGEICDTLVTAGVKERRGQTGEGGGTCDRERGMEEEEEEEEQRMSAGEQ